MSPSMSKDELFEQKQALKRATGAIACLECRRSRRKCDRNVPCGLCIRRGLRSLCPNGATTAQTAAEKARLLSRERGLKVVVPAAGKLRLLFILSTRMRTLEDALLIESDNQHPLLTTDEEHVGSSSSDHTTSIDGNQDAGTLSVAKDHGEWFLGTGAGESLVMLDIFGAASTESSLLDDAQLHLSADIVLASILFPFGSIKRADTKYWRCLTPFLPSYDRAILLVNMYHLAKDRQAVPVKPQQTDEDLLPRFYPSAAPLKADTLEISDLHDLGLLFAIMATGCSNDPSMPQVNVEAESYAHLSRAALTFYNIMEHATLSAVQAVLVLGSYVKAVQKTTSHEMAWNLLAFASHLALSIGLHIDPSRWHIGRKAANLRRRVFFECYHTECWRSLTLGRPIAFSKHAISCELPDDDFILDNGKMESVANWQYRFSKEVMADIADAACSVDPVPYSEIQRIDSKLQEFPPHPLVFSRNMTVSSDGQNVPMVQGWSSKEQENPMVTIFAKQEAIQILHRHYFARAMLDERQSPFDGPYATSVIAAYRSAILMQNLVIQAVRKIQKDVLRQHSMWRVSIVCGIIIGSVACRGSTGKLATSAAIELDKTIQAFEMVQEHPTAREGLSIMHRMRETARRRAEVQPSHGIENDARAQAAFISNITEPDDCEAQLRLLAGTTQLHRTRLQFPEDDAQVETLSAISYETSKPVTSLDAIPQDTAAEAEIAWADLMSRVTEAEWTL